MPCQAKEDPKAGIAAAFSKSKAGKDLLLLSSSFARIGSFETVECVYGDAHRIGSRCTIKSDRYSEIFAKGEVIKNIRLGGHPMIDVYEYYGQ